MRSLSVCELAPRIVGPRWWSGDARGGIKCKGRDSRKIGEEGRVSPYFCCNYALR
jgi:hypothetical protein